MDNKDRFKYPVINIAEAFNSSVSGTSDPLHPYEALEFREFLKWRIDNWTPTGNGTRFSVAYDNAVKDLCVAAVELYELNDMQDDLEWVEKNPKHPHMGGE